mmetsp:Transcript_78569/g.188493  ORF Transcript_78569/g.188493 Transcript_78569/m.188493 type:complete len:388 (-) Transcript_78569:1605-2768(-)
MPTRSLAHDIAVEGVENTLVCQLQRVVQQDHVLRLSLGDQVPTLFRLLQLLVPLFRLLLEHVSPVAEVQDRVHVERILALANDILLVLVDGALEPLVGLLRKLAHRLDNLLRALPLSQLRPLHTGDLPGVSVLVVVEPLLALHLIDNGLHICPGSHIEVGPVLPLHLPLAIVGGVIVGAGVAKLLVHDRHGLQAIGQDDVRVHGTHIQMVDQRKVVLDHAIGRLLHFLAARLDTTLAFDHLILHHLELIAILFLLLLRLQRGGLLCDAPHLRCHLVGIAKGAQLCLHFCEDLLVVLHVLQLHLLFLQEEEIHCGFEVLEKGLDGGGFDLEGLLDVGTVHPHSHAFHTSALIGGALHQAVGALVELKRRVDVLVGKKHIGMCRLVHEQ